MSHKMQSCERSLDYISALPENLMYLIMERLPLLDAGRLGVLSRKWRSIWLSLPKLTFDSKFFKDVLKNKQYNSSEIYCILSTILLSHVGPITEFKLNVPKVKSGVTCFESPCISFLSRNNVKSIVLHNINHIPVKVSSHIFSCVELEKLRLTNYIIDLPPYYNGFRNLTSLILENITFMKNSFDVIVASCPKLEILTLSNSSGVECIDITARKLKYLMVSGKFESVRLHDSPNLIAILIMLEEEVENFHSITSQELMRYLSNLRDLRKLIFRGYFCKMLAKGETRGMLPTEYKCVKVLELSNIESSDLAVSSFVVRMIQRCPNVVEVKIVFSSTGSVEHNLESNAYNIPLHHLRRVHLYSVKGVVMELKLIELLLLCSPQLEQLYVGRDLSINADLEINLARQLMRFRRTSSKAEIIYVDPIS